MNISAGIAPVWAASHGADLREAACLARIEKRAMRARRSRERSR
jgi:hypothetical protein